MIVGALFSGGKDSAYAAHLAQAAGHDVRCLLTLEGGTPESMLLHRPNISWTSLQAESMGIRRLAAPAPDDPAGGEAALRSLLERAASEFGITGAVHGGLRSRYQRDRFAAACAAAGLEALAPLWGMGGAPYVRSLLSAGFRFVVSSVSAGGLDGSWLGREVTRGALGRLEALAASHGFSVDFEGGEAETFVTSCPMFSREVRITGSRISWDSYRGELEITRAVLG
ncbi:MAG: diphthine--ammonia ligase [Nitrosopumilus sp.]|nr:diphthine--ammonia ligase [Nitrosopumilus sp.]MDA7953630.1 diphthine--ammonia ligase [Nitrosopumilus sp.]MDA7958153.1 diphthine--ammonia ligase [Nitrosopumilus sp.]MDA7998919.1 diphthine--ammonia ligase [Nitrosopumilus sp.]